MFAICGKNERALEPHLNAEVKAAACKALERTVRLLEGLRGRPPASGIVGERYDRAPRLMHVD
jgi:hypothetical protein